MLVYVAKVDSSDVITIGQWLGYVLVLHLWQTKKNNNKYDFHACMTSQIFTQFTYPMNKI